jgi:hypothetical protein
VNVGRVALVAVGGYDEVSSPRTPTSICAAAFHGSNRVLRRNAGRTDVAPDPGLQDQARSRAIKGEQTPAVPTVWTEALARIGVEPGTRRSSASRIPAPSDDRSCPPGPSGARERPTSGCAGGAACRSFAVSASGTQADHPGVCPTCRPVSPGWSPTGCPTTCSTKSLPLRPRHRRGHLWPPNRSLDQAIGVSTSRSALRVRAPRPAQTASPCYSSANPITTTCGDARMAGQYLGYMLKPPPMIMSLFRSICSRSTPPPSSDRPNPAPPAPGATESRCRAGSFDTTDLSRRPSMGKKQRDCVGCGARRRVSSAGSTAAGACAGSGRRRRKHSARSAGRIGCSSMPPGGACGAPAAAPSAAARTGPGTPRCADRACATPNGKPRRPAAPGAANSGSRAETGWCGPCS